MSSFGTAWASRTLRALYRLVVLVLLGVAVGCRNAPPPLLLQLDTLRNLTTDLRLQFVKASDGSNQAVMADTDEASIAFAKDAERGMQAIDADVSQLAPLLQSLGLTDETRLLEAFKKHFAEYRDVDRRVRELAVENTNLKAQKLSFGPVMQAADGFRDSLGAIAAGVPSNDQCKAAELVARATLAVRQVQVLQAPHIAEADDAAMTRLEKDMAALESDARDAVKTLGALAPQKAPAVAAAEKVLDQFTELSDRVVKLSRRNSNVVSLDLSLRAKPPLTTACEESLAALESALVKEGSKATR